MWSWWDNFRGPAFPRHRTWFLSSTLCRPFCSRHPVPVHLLSLLICVVLGFHPKSSHRFRTFKMHITFWITNLSHLGAFCVFGWYPWMFVCYYQVFAHGCMWVPSTTLKGAARWVLLADKCTRERPGATGLEAGPHTCPSLHVDQELDLHEWPGMSCLSERWHCCCNCHCVFFVVVLLWRLAQHFYFYLLAGT